MRAITDRQPGTGHGGQGIGTGVQQGAEESCREWKGVEEDGGLGCTKRRTPREWSTQGIKTSLRNRSVDAPVVRCPTRGQRAASRITHACTH